MCQIEAFVCFVKSSYRRDSDMLPYLVADYRVCTCRGDPQPALSRVNFFHRICDDCASLGNPVSPSAGVDAAVPELQARGGWYGYRNNANRWAGSHDGSGGTRTKPLAR